MNRIFGCPYGNVPFSLNTSQFFPSTFRSTGNNSEQLSNEDLLETTQQEMMFLKKELARKEEEITKLRQVDATFTETATFNLEVRLLSFCLSLERTSTQGNSSKP